MNLDCFNKTQEETLAKFLTRKMSFRWKCRTFADYINNLLPDAKSKRVFLSKLDNSERVLEIGCGWGNALSGIFANSQKATLVVGVDINKRSLDLAQTLAEIALPECQILRVDEQKGIPDQVWADIKKSKRKCLVLYQTDAAGAVRCKEDKFDMIFSVNAFRYFTDKISALTQAIFTLKDGCSAYFTMGAEDILILENEPGVQLLLEVQKNISENRNQTTTKAISSLFEKKDHQLFDADSFVREYLDGIIANGSFHPTGKYPLLRIDKKSSIVQKKKLPSHYSFLIGKQQNHKVVSIYVANKS